MNVTAKKKYEKKRKWEIRVSFQRQQSNRKKQPKINILVEKNR